VNRRVKTLIFNLLVLAVVILAAPSARACAACFGQSDGPMARGMNAGIFTLLGVIGIVLCGFFALMIYLVRRGGVYSDAMTRQVEAIRRQNEGEALTTTA
jgi:hypothetical protein